MNNTEKNTYVREQLTNSLLLLLKQKKLADISISELVNIAKVGRASFYRNYDSLSDILVQHDRKLIQNWTAKFEENPVSSPENVFESLFSHYKQNSEFYLLLHKKGLSEIMLHTFQKHCGMSDNTKHRYAYSNAFFTYGLYGCLLEWIDKGMIDSPKNIKELFSLSENGLLIRFV